MLLLSSVAAVTCTHLEVSDQFHLASFSCAHKSDNIIIRSSRNIITPYTLTTVLKCPLRATQKNVT